MKKTTQIVCLDSDGIPDRIRLTPPDGPHNWVEYANTPAEQLLQRAKTANILVTNKVPLRADVLSQCQNVQHIAVTATGYNIIDIDYCCKNGISVSNVPAYATTTVPEHVIACALTLRREILRYRQRVIDGAWQNSDAFCLFDKPFHDLRGATLGIIGMGTIGRAVAKLAQTLGMTVLYQTRRHSKINQTDLGEPTDLITLLKSSDIVSVHCALNEQTENLLSSEELSEMPPHAILINTARGGIVNELAVVNAIQSDQLGGIAFDVLMNEPPQNDSPLLSIANRDNVIITPHIAWASDGAMQRLANIVSSNIGAFIDGKPQNLVT